MTSVRTESTTIRCSDSGSAVERSHIARRRSDADLWVRTQITPTTALPSALSLSEPAQRSRSRSVSRACASTEQRRALLDYAKSTQGNFTWVREGWSFGTCFGFVTAEGTPPVHPSYLGAGGGYFVFTCDFRDQVRKSDMPSKGVSQLAPNATMNCMEYVYLGLVKAGVASPKALRSILQWEEDASCSESEWFEPLGTLSRRPFDGQEQAGDLVFFEHANDLKHVGIFEGNISDHPIYQLGPAQKGAQCVLSAEIAANFKHAHEDLSAVSITYVPFVTAAHAFRSHAHACLKLKA